MWGPKWQLPDLDWKDQHVPHEEVAVCRALLPSMQAVMQEGIKGGKHSLFAFMKEHAAGGKGYL